ncbi:MAG: DUF1802 family protein, partial [Leptolyngbyaceae bacterium]|nr:DUF1802 family protein [Leptolyngbyaceae bacterium]
MSNQSVSISQALCLPSANITALTIGQMTAILAPGFLRGLNSQFALCPVDGNSPQVSATITHWAKVEGCKPHKDPEKIDALSLITTWSREQLTAILQERPHFFLAYVRVYRLSEPVTVEGDRLPTDPLNDFGTFIRLNQTIAAPLTHPVLDEQPFNQRHQQLIKLTPPEHPELLQLQQQVAQLNSLEAIAFNRDMQEVLGWNPPPANPFDHP